MAYSMFGISDDISMQVVAVGFIIFIVVPYMKESCLQDSPPAAGRFSDIIPLRRSAILPEGLFYVIGTLQSNFL